MGRRSWIKLYTNVVFGSTSKELLPAERWAWIGLLALAGDSIVDGFVCLSETLGYTNEQLADILSIDIEVLTAAFSKMVATGKIAIDSKNKISILNWKKYQSEYDRQKGYRTKLQPKVTDHSDAKSLSSSSLLSSQEEKRGSGGGEDLQSEDPDARLCAILIALMLENDPKSSVAKLSPHQKQAWARDCACLRTLDKRDVSEIEAVIHWSQGDPFWRSVILSPAALRKNFAKLLLKMNSGPEAEIRKELEVGKNRVPENGSWTPAAAALLPQIDAEFEKKYGDDLFNAPSRKTYRLKRLKALMTE
ncbi:MAG: phage replisome organizer N-terminal domain-containing protein [Candidatus Aminicenantes bacterium]|nr:phage replisome organizer N-terminal domain-containing protein [Candidatus Aminicenantes bacterium]